MFPFPIFEENIPPKERTTLHGTKEQKIEQMLQKAGWFCGRKVDITPVIEYYQKRNIKRNDKVIAFFEEYYGLIDYWEVIYLSSFDGKSLEHRADVYFYLFPYDEVRDFMYDDVDFVVESEEYKSVKDFSKEYVVMVGMIGYHYPARVWIGESGKIYCTHDYEDDVLLFDSVVQLLLHELCGFHEEDMIAVIM